MDLFKDIDLMRWLETGSGRLRRSPTTWVCRWALCTRGGCSGRVRPCRRLGRVLRYRPADVEEWFSTLGDWSETG